MVFLGPFKKMGENRAESLRELDALQHGAVAFGRFKIQGHAENPSPRCCEL